MRTFLTLLLSFVCAPIFAQSVQRGLVQEYNGKETKTPLSGVELAIRSANSTISDKNGNFILNFLTLQPGDRINVRDVRKEGFEIFNKEALEQWNLNPNTSFVVIMCRSTKFKELCDNYHSKASANYKKQYDRGIAKLNKLKSEGKVKDEEYKKQLIEIQKNYNQQLDNLDNYVDRFARIDLSSLKDEEQKIIELVQLGLFDEAIAKYDDLNIKDKLKTLIHNRNHIREAVSSLETIENRQTQSIDSLYAMAERQIEILMLNGGPENNNKVVSIYNEIASIDTTNINWLFKGGLFISACTSDYDTARKYYQTALNHALKVYGFSHPAVATAYNNIASTYDYQANYDKALECYNKALKIRLDVLGNDDPQVATTYNNMGIVYSKCGDYKTALDYYQKALDIRNSNYGDMRRDIAQSYNNIGSAYHYSGNSSKALENYLKAFNIWAKILNENHQDMALIYSNIGAAYNDCGDIEKAFEYSRKGLELSEKLYGSEHPSVARSNNNMGLIYCQLKDYEKAREYFMKSLSVREKLYGNLHPDLAGSYNNVATTYHYQIQFDKALDYYRKALSIYEKTLGSNHPMAIQIDKNIQLIINEQYKQ